MVRLAAERYSDLEAVVDGDVRLTFAQLAEAVDGVRPGRPWRRGIEPGDRVGRLGAQHLEWIVAALGLLSAGAVLVPLNTRFKGAEAAYILGKSRARILFCVNGFLGNDYVAMLDALARPTCPTSRPSSSCEARRRPGRSAGPTIWPPGRS